MTLRLDRYLALGDSFTIGTGITPDRSFPAMLVDRSRGTVAIELRNPAVNGYTTEDLIRDELPQATHFRPTFVTLLIGANDIVRRWSEERYGQQLGRIHQGLSDAGVPAESVVALPQPYWSSAPVAASFGDRAALRATIERFNSVARSEAERFAGRYVDLSALMADQAERKLFASDGLHPSAAAHAEWADAILKALDR
ncbi:MAG: SGNH/GDSL hydrolase family protein [Chloroflexota bacterium]|nr:SGNH/GDSL hydrolase family protein [Chloroflexota bacterium]